MYFILALFTKKSDGSEYFTFQIIENNQIFNLNEKYDKIILYKYVDLCLPPGTVERIQEIRGEMEELYTSYAGKIDDDQYSEYVCLEDELRGLLMEVHSAIEELL